jgi:hypothetical protein
MDFSFRLTVYAGEAWQQQELSDYAKINKGVSWIVPNAGGFAGVTRNVATTYDCLYCVYVRYECIIINRYLLGTVINGYL